MADVNITIDEKKINRPESTSAVMRRTASDLSEEHSAAEFHFTSLRRGDETDDWRFPGEVTANGISVASLPNLIVEERECPLWLPICAGASIVKNGS
jgi:hypothetical protein